MRLYIIPLIEGLPPKKDGSKSMWHKWDDATEINRLITLRRCVQEKMAGELPLASEIQMNVRIHTGRYGREKAGDLDNFVAGIFDGIAGHSCGDQGCARWNDDDFTKIHPRDWRAVENDHAIVSIQATKVASDGEP